MRTCKTDTYADGSPRHLDPTPSALRKSPASRFTVHDLAMVRRVVLETLDSKTWLLYEQIQDGVVLWKEWQADKERLELCDEICARIISDAK